MTIQEFIDQNRGQLQVVIKKAVGFVPRTASCYCPMSGTDHYHYPDDMDDEEIRQWVLNDEGLYDWARAEGVEL